MSAYSWDAMTAVDLRVQMCWHAECKWCSPMFMMMLAVRTEGVPVEA